MCTVVSSVNAFWRPWQHKSRKNYMPGEVQVGFLQRLGLKDEKLSQWTVVEETHKTEPRRYINPHMHAQHVMFKGIQVLFRITQA